MKKPLSPKNLPTLDAVRKERAERGLLSFIREAWPVVEPGTTFVPGWHIKAICEHLEAVTRGEITRLLINVPPRHMKSLTVGVFWPCWEWIRRPETRYLYASYAQALAVRDNVKRRRLLTHPWYRARWGEAVALSGDENRKGRFENTRGGFCMATSVGGQVTGEGGDRVVVDDPHNAKEARSATKRAGVLEWWDQAMSTRLNDAATGAMVIVMQRLHEQDLAGHVLQQGGWEHLCLPAEYEKPRPPTCINWCDPRTTPGELLWPQRVGADELAKLKRALGSYGAAGQLQQRPAPEGGGIFKRHWWRFYRLPPPPDTIVRVIQSWDTGFKTGDNNAYSVGQTWAQGRDGYYLLDQIRGRYEYPELRRAVIAYYHKHTPDSVLIEDKASGQSLLQDLRRDTVLPLTPVAVMGGDKELRAHSVSPQAEAGKIFLPESSEWLSDFLQEAERFPASAFADQVDAMTQALATLAHAKRYAPSGERHWN